MGGGALDGFTRAGVAGMLAGVAQFLKEKGHRFGRLMHCNSGGAGAGVQSRFFTPVP